MHHTRKNIFWKCWIWSIAGGILFATVFWLLSDVGDLFHLYYGGGIFLYILFGFSILGSYIGAGIVGWRIADKYYHHAVKRFMKQYRLYSIFSLIVLGAVIYSPAPYLGFLWSILAPFCALTALSKTSSPSPKKV
jgi:hypothetical protein